MWLDPSFCLLASVFLGRKQRSLRPSREGECFWWPLLLAGLPVDLICLMLPGGFPLDLGEECDYLVCLLFLGWWLGNVRSGLLPSVRCRDIKHPAALLFLQSWGFQIDFLPSYHLSGFSFGRCLCL